MMFKIIRYRIEKNNDEYILSFQDNLKDFLEHRWTACEYSKSKFRVDTWKILYGIKNIN
jgi:hypothetical protein